jgi:glutathione peroxidase-family protein
MTIFDVSIGALTGGATELDRYRGRVAPVVNEASRCGLTPQYAKLQSRFGPGTAPDDGEIVATIEKPLPH